MVRSGVCELSRRLFALVYFRLEKVATFPCRTIEKAAVPILFKQLNCLLKQTFVNTGKIEKC